MTVVVTGSTGHIGTNLVEAVAAAGREVVTVDLDEPAHLPAGVRRIRADVRDRDAMREAFAGASTVFHLAAIISVVGGRGGLVDSVNVGGVRATARAALDVGVRRFVHCSSVHAFDLERCRGTTVTEDSPRSVDPRLPAYDRSKAAGEAALREVVADGLDAVVLNPSGVIGPRDDAPSRMGAVLLAAAVGRLPATVAGTFDWVDVRDVVAALTAAETRGTTGANHLLGGHSASLAELVRIACAVTGARRPPDLPLWFARIWSPAATAAARRSANLLLYAGESLHAVSCRPVVDHSRATDVLGHHPRPLVETVTDLLLDFTARGLLAATQGAWTRA